LPSGEIPFPRWHPFAAAKFNAAPNATPMLEVVGGLFAGVYGAFHEALFIGDVFAGELHVVEWPLQNRAHGEPLARAIEGVRSGDPTLLLPGLHFYVDDIRLMQDSFRGALHVFGNPLPYRLLAWFGRDVVGFIANGVAAENSSGLGLQVGTLEAEIGNAIGEHGEAAFFRSVPKAFGEEHGGLGDARVLQLVCGFELAGRQRRIPLDVAQATRGNGADAGIGGELLAVAISHFDAAAALDDGFDRRVLVDGRRADGGFESVNEASVSARDLEIHFVGSVGFGAEILGGGSVGGSLADGFAEIGAVHEVALEQRIVGKAEELELRPPIAEVELALLREGIVGEVAAELGKDFLQGWRERPPAGWVDG